MRNTDEQYEVESNPIIDILLEYMLTYNEDIYEEKIISQMYYDFINYISFNIDDPNEIENFDYELKFDKSLDMVSVKPKNILSALWLCNIFPKNGLKVLHDGEYIDGDKKYRFLKRNKRLIVDEQ